VNSGEKASVPLDPSFTVVENVAEKSCTSQQFIPCMYWVFEVHNKRNVSKKFKTKSNLKQREYITSLFGCQIANSYGVLSKSSINAGRKKREHVQYMHTY
jgi:hypothetical protein